MSATTYVAPKATVFCYDEDIPTSSKQETAMRHMTDAVEQIKHRVTETVPADLIRRLCQEAGHHWRERALGPAFPPPLFLRQILDGTPAVGELRRRTHLEFTEAAYCRARARLPRTVLE